MSEIHVIPDERTGTWRVADVDAACALSEHPSATDAELAARAWARERGAVRVVVHDRYHRVHDAARARHEDPAALAARKPAAGRRPSTTPA